MFVFANSYADERASTKNTSHDSHYLVVPTRRIYLQSSFLPCSRTCHAQVLLSSTLWRFFPEILFILECNEKLDAVAHSCGVDNGVL